MAVMLTSQASGSLAQTDPLRTVMREKLSNTQQLLEAVVRADYGSMARYSELLSRITYTEIASWQAVAHPDYTRNATQFLLSVKGIGDAAAEKNGEEAARQYTTLIGSCVACHAYVQRARSVRFESLEPPRDPLTIGQPAFEIRSNATGL
jgi:hypothetical protein